MKPLNAPSSLSFTPESPSGVRKRQAPTGETARYLASEHPFLGRVPVLLVDIAQLRGLGFDRGTEFLVSLIDGASNIETILDRGATPKEDVLRVLDELLGMGIVAFA